MVICKRPFLPLRENVTIGQLGDIKRGVLHDRISEAGGD